MKRSRAAAVIASTAALVPLRIRAQGAAPYKLGVTVPMTGPFQPFSVELFKGGQIAEAEINRAGGIGGHPRCKLVVEDSQGSPQAGVAAMRKLVQVDGVPAMLTFFTNVLTAQIPLADELKIPTISAVEAPGLFAKSEYSFSHAPTWGEALPVMAAYWKAHGIKRIYGLLTNSGLGQLQSTALRAKVQEIGGTYDEARLDPNTTDFRGVITRARDADPQIVMLTGQGTGLEANAIKQIRELGMSTPIWSFAQSYDSKSFRDAVGPYGEGMIAGGLHLDPNLPAANAFARSYRAAMGYLPGYAAANIHDVVRIFAYAIGKAGYNGPAIREVVATLKGFPSTLGGTITMGPDHYTEFSSAGLSQVRGGKLVRLSG